MPRRKLTTSRFTANQIAEFPEVTWLDGKGVVPLEIAKPMAQDYLVCLDLLTAIFENGCLTMGTWLYEDVAEILDLPKWRECPDCKGVPKLKCATCKNEGALPV
jgi:hypothetical protein